MPPTVRIKGTLVKVPTYKEPGLAIWEVETYDGLKEVHISVPYKALKSTVKPGDLLLIEKSGNKTLAQQLTPYLDYEAYNVYEVEYADDTKEFCKSQKLEGADIITVVYDYLKPDFHEGQSVYLYVYRNANNEIITQKVISAES